MCLTVKKRILSQKVETYYKVIEIKNKEYVPIYSFQSYKYKLNVPIKAVFDGKIPRLFKKDEKICGGYFHMFKNLEDAKTIRDMIIEDNKEFRGLFNSTQSIVVKCTVPKQILYYGICTVENFVFESVCAKRIAMSFIDEKAIPD